MRIVEEVALDLFSDKRLELVLPSCTINSLLPSIVSKHTHTHREREIEASGMNSSHREGHELGVDGDDVSLPRQPIRREANHLRHGPVLRGGRRRGRYRCRGATGVDGEPHKNGGKAQARRGGGGHVAVIAGPSQQLAFNDRVRHGVAEKKK